MAQNIRQLTLLSIAALARQYKLEAALLAGALFIAAATGAAQYAYVEMERTREVAEAHRALMNLALAYEGDVGNVLGHIDESLREFRKEVESGRGASAWRLPHGTDHDGLILQYSHIGADGRLAWSSLPFTPVDLSDREHFQVFRNGGDDRPFLSKPLVGRVSGRDSIQVARRVRLQNGGFGGVAVASIDPHRLVAFWQQASLGTGLELGLVGRDGVVRIRIVAGQTQFGLAQPTNSPLWRAMQAHQGKGAFQGISPIDGIGRIGVFRMLDNWNLAVVVVEQEEDALQDHFSRRRDYLAWYGAFVAGLAILTIYLFAGLRSQRRMDERLQLANQAGRLYPWAWDVTGDKLVWQCDPQPLLGQMPAGGYPDFRELVLPEDRHVLAEAMERAREDGRDYEAAFRIRTAEGGQRWIMARGLLRGSKARPVLVGVSRDITERKRLGERTRQLNRELEERVAARTAELEQAFKDLESFTYATAHDLRTPLRSIDAYARIVLEEAGALLATDHRNMLGRMIANADTISELLDLMHDYTRLAHAPLNVQALDMRDLARKAAGSAHGADIAIGALPPARGDASLIGRVFEELIGNAVKFSARSPAPRIEVGATRESGETVWFVRDNGAGFDMQHAGKLFSMFWRLHRETEYPGLGYGLAMAKRVIDRHGGRIWAEAAPDRGATFYFTLGNQNDAEIDSGSAASTGAIDA